MPAPLLALDVALRLPSSIEDVLAAVNAGLAPPPHGFRFDATHLPHISLAQQFSPAADVDAIRGVIRDAVADEPPVALTTGEVVAGGTAVAAHIRTTAQLDLLHRRLMDRLTPFDLGGGRAEAFATTDGVPAEPARTRDIEWVNSFRTASAYDAFRPHVTLGIGPTVEAVAPPGPLRFDAGGVMLCVLGRFCTCREILDSWALTARS